MKSFPPTSVCLLAGMLGFLGLGALIGGAMLIISPSGEWIGIPISLLKHTIFPNFLIPGLILFLIIGVFPSLLVWPMFSKSENKMLEKMNWLTDMRWMWTFSLYSAFALILWIQIEIVLIGSISWLHTFYMVLGLFIILLALLPTTRLYFKK